MENLTIFYDESGNLNIDIVLTFHLTTKGKNYLLSQSKESNFFDLISYYEYGVNCYRLPLYMFLYLFENKLSTITDFIKPITSDYVERSLCGSGGCISCPFSCGDEAETAQNYGCLPDASDILRMKFESGHNWSCHSDETKVCGGLSSRIKELGLESVHNVNLGGLIKYNTWYHEGEERALEEAQEGLKAVKKLNK